ncbi:hypothetical protein GCM10022220_31990 [Actinocatenispora rupis]
MLHKAVDDALGLWTTGPRHHIGLGRSAGWGAAPGQGAAPGWGAASGCAVARPWQEIKHLHDRDGLR